MTDTILSTNHRKAELSFAYLAALSAFAGYTCQRGPEPDQDSIDSTIRSGDSMRSQFDVQLKSTSVPMRRQDGLHFRLHRKNYNDLTLKRQSPLILVVLELPTDEKDWLACTADQLLLRRCAWWMSVRGREPIDTDSKVVVIPDAQRLNETSLEHLMDRARRRTL